MRKIISILVIAASLVFMKCSDSDDDPDSNNSLHYSYTLKLSFNYESWPAATFSWALTDMATMDIEVNDSIVTFSNIRNEEGTVWPLSQFIENGIETCTATWEQTESPLGYINIVSATGELFIGGEQKIMLSIHVTSSNARTPKFSYVCTRSGSVETGGESLVSYTYHYIFDLENRVQNQTISVLAASLVPVN